MDPIAGVPDSLIKYLELHGEQVLSLDKYVSHALHLLTE